MHLTYPQNYWETFFFFTKSTNTGTSHHFRQTGLCTTKNLKKKKKREEKQRNKERKKKNRKERREKRRNKEKRRVTRTGLLSFVASQ